MAVGAITELIGLPGGKPSKMPASLPLDFDVTSVKENYFEILGVEHDMFNLTIDLHYAAKMTSADCTTEQKEACTIAMTVLKNSLLHVQYITLHKNALLKYFGKSSLKDICLECPV